MDFTALSEESNGEGFAHHSANIWSKARGAGLGEGYRRKSENCLKNWKEKWAINAHIIKIHIKESWESESKEEKEEREGDIA